MHKDEGEMGIKDIFSIRLYLLNENGDYRMEPKENGEMY